MTMYGYSAVVCPRAALPRNDCSVVLFLQQKPHALQLAAVGVPGFHGVDPGGVYAGVTQDIRQTDDVLLHTIICAGKQMAQVVGKYLRLRYPCLAAQTLHLVPDVAAVQGTARAGDKHRAPGDAPPPGVI